MNTDYLPIGCGYKILSNEKASAVISDANSTYRKQGYMTAWITDSKSERSLKKKLETSTDVSAGWAQVSTGGKLDYSSEITHSETTDHHSISFIMRTHIETIDDNSDQKTEHVIQNISALQPRDFYDRYGDSYIQSIEHGGLVRYDCTFDEKQDQIIKNLETQLHAQGLDVAKIEQAIKILTESKVIDNNSSITISSVPPTINIEKMSHVDQVKTALTEFNDEINKIKDAKDVPAIIYNWVSYYKHPLLRTIPMIKTVADISKKAVLGAKELRILKTYLSNIEESSRRKPYNLKNQILISNISYDCYKTNRLQITEWLAQIEEFLSGLKANIFNIGEGAELAKVRDPIKAWLKKPMSTFAVTHLLTHVVDPTRKFVIVGPLSYKFQGKILKFVTPTSYLYIDVAGEDKFKDQKLSIRIQYWKSTRSGYKDLFAYGINSNTQEILKSDPVDRDQLIYIQAREILDRHIKIKLYTGEGSTRKRVRDPCLLRIYVTEVEESVLLGQIQDPEDQRRGYKSIEQVDSTELKADELEQKDNADMDPAPDPEEYPDEPIPEDEYYKSLKDAGVIIDITDA